MDVKLLNDEYQKCLFLRNYNQQANMNVPLNYILDCRVFGVFIDSQLMGGFAIAYGDDMAWPQVIPSGNSFLKAVPSCLCLEVNLVWAKDKLHQSYVHMLQFWLTIGKTVGKHPNHEYVTFAVDASYRYLVALYKRISIGTVYEGSIQKYPGRKAIVFYTSPFRCRYAKFFCIREFYIRYKRKYLSENLRWAGLNLALVRRKNP